LSDITSGDGLEISEAALIGIRDGTFRAECGQEAFDLVNWASIGVAMSELKRSWRVFVAKHCSGMCGVGKFYEEMERMG